MEAVLILHSCCLKYYLIVCASVFYLILHSVLLLLHFLLLCAVKPGYSTFHNTGCPSSGSQSRLYLQNDKIKFLSFYTLISHVSKKG